METILNKESRAAIELMIADGLIAKDTAERYFPELKESKGEKTKRILHSISSKISFHLRDIFTEEEFQCFDAWSHAWLKEQGEHAKFRDSIQVGDKVTRNEDGVLVNLSQLKRVAKPAEKFPKYEKGDILTDGKNKYEVLSWDYTETGIAAYYMKGVGCKFSWSCEEADKKLKPLEQNPTWSEEDERMLDEMYKFFDTHKVPSLKHDMNDYAKFIKSLKERVLPQPKQEWKQENTGDLTDFENAMMHIGGSFFGENAGLDPNDTNVVKEQANFLLGLAQSKEWSEEDENRFNNLIFLVECSEENDATKEGFTRFINKLKSLRPQNTCKPSDEQMKLLGEVQQALLGKDCHNRFVLFMHELKRLREE